MIGRDLLMTERVAEQKQARFNKTADTIASYGIAVVYGILAALFLSNL